MTTARSLIDDLTQRGVRLEARGDQLHVEAPKGVLSPAVLSALRAEKSQIIHLLTLPAGGGNGNVAGAAASIDAALAQMTVQRDAWRKVCRELGETCGWPALTYKPGHAVSPGEANWLKYVSRASVPDLVRVMGALQGVLETLPRAPDLDAPAVV